MTSPTSASRAGGDTAPAVELSSLVKSFKGANGTRFRAVDDLTMTVPRGQIVAFLGPNGAGKTTTLDMLLGLTDPDAGTARVLGKPARRAVLDGHVSAVLQTGGLLADLKVKETVRMIASMLTRPAPVADVLERAGLTDLATRKVSKLSGGEQQRLRFALALLPDPDVLVLDEPTAGMDVKARHEFWDRMRSEADAGRTVVFATHYLQEADQFAERIIMIARGKVIADGSTSEIREMSSGRQVSIDIPDDASREDYLETLRGLDGVQHVERIGSRAAIRATDTDALALTLLRDLQARNLEIASADLDSAFLNLTGDPATEDEAADTTTGTTGKDQS